MSASQSKTFFLLAKLVMVTFALCALPAIVWRWTTIMHVTQPLRTIAAAVFIVATVYDVHLLFDILRLRPEDLRLERIGLRQVPSLAFAFVIALMVDAPAIAHAARNVAITRIATQEAYRLTPGQRQFEYERHSEQLHFLSDPVVSLISNPYEDVDPTREAFLNRYANGTPVTLHLTRDRCTAFERSAASVSLSSYPLIDESTRRIAGFCAALNGRVAQAAKDYESFEASVYLQTPEDPPLAFGAVFAAEEDTKSTALLSYLQQSLINDTAARANIRRRCLKEYHAPITMFAWGGRWTPRSITEAHAWRRHWAAMFGPVCLALHAVDRYTVTIPALPATHTAL
ncbi:hypothetical protein EPN42_04805 [bacterium]|nr:MAG: hypothetical protein EPN42_04805 [bacterium]